MENWPGSQRSVYKLRSGDRLGGSKRAFQWFPALKGEIGGHLKGRQGRALSREIGFEGYSTSESRCGGANRVRAIITKLALQEGWDCPFAYVLCALAANSNLKAMTQLVGRILRQPGAIKTEVSALDECHVITHRTDTATVVEAIKDGLEKDGLGDLFLQVSQDDTSGTGAVARKIDRRPAFASAEIYLPKVMIVNGGEARDLDYETDVLSSIDWRGFDPKDIAVRTFLRMLRLRKASCSGSSLRITATSCSLARPLRKAPKRLPLTLPMPFG